MSVESLSSYRRCAIRIESMWKEFRSKRQERLLQQSRHGHAAERVTEAILEDLLTTVLDWSVADLNNQVAFSDLLLTRLGVRYLLLELKRPGALAWNQNAVHAALEQACRYADSQHVGTVAVSDGVMLYAADRTNGGLRGRLFATLESTSAPLNLWWISVHGIYRQPDHEALVVLARASDDLDRSPGEVQPSQDFLHPKLGLPSRCFAYVGDTCNPKSWKLPYRRGDGRPDATRLPKAVRSILSNYRGEKVAGIPESAVADVLVRLAVAAAELGRMPSQRPETATIYIQLAQALEQFGRPLKNVTVL